MSMQRASPCTCQAATKWQLESCWHAGGTFALYARLARCCKLPTPTATEQEFDTNLNRYGTKLEKGARPSIGTFVSPTALALPCPQRTCNYHQLRSACRGVVQC